MPVVYHREIDDQTSLAIWKIEETAEELYAKLQLKEHEIAYISLLNKGKRSLHWLSTRVLLREMLNTNAYIDCEVDEHGKPYLVNFPHHISLSHSFDMAAVMVSKSRPVGIDIEIIKEKIDKIKQKFLNPDELERIGPPHEIEQLYACWCAKEAIYKWNGQKGLEFKKHMHIQPFDYADEGLMKAKVTMPGGELEMNIAYLRFDDYMLGYTL